MKLCEQKAGKWLPGAGGKGMTSEGHGGTLWSDGNVL